MIAHVGHFIVQVYAETEFEHDCGHVVVRVSVDLLHTAHAADRVRHFVRDRVFDGSRRRTG